MISILKGIPPLAPGLLDRLEAPALVDRGLLFADDGAPSSTAPFLAVVRGRIMLKFQLFLELSQHTEFLPLKKMRVSKVVFVG